MPVAYRNALFVLLIVASGIFISLASSDNERSINPHLDESENIAVEETVKNLQQKNLVEFRNFICIPRYSNPFMGYGLVNIHVHTCLESLPDMDRSGSVKKGVVR